MLGALRGFALAALVFSSRGGRRVLRAKRCVLRAGFGLRRRASLGDRPDHRSRVAATRHDRLRRRRARDAGAHRRVRLFGLAFALTGGLVGLMLSRCKRSWCARFVGCAAQTYVRSRQASALYRCCSAHRLGRTFPRATRRCGAGRARGIRAARVGGFATDEGARVRAIAECAGKINVIEFSDFECPFCRAVHPVLWPCVRAVRDAHALVRKSFETW